jgi:type II secretory pathway pseudopilin PulG
MLTIGASSFRERARKTKTVAQIAQIETALEAYRGDFLKYPSDGTPVAYEDSNAYLLEQLSGKNKTTGAYDSLVTGDSRWNGPYLDPKSEDIRLLGGERVHVDAWKSAFNLRTANDQVTGDGNPPHNRALTFDIWSNGPNKTNDSSTHAQGGLAGDDIGNF